MANELAFFALGIYGHDLPKQHGAPIWEQLTTDEIKELSSTIAGLGRIPSQVVEHLLVQFTGEVASMASLHGSYETTERLLGGILPTPSGPVVPWAANRNDAFVIGTDRAL